MYKYVIKLLMEINFEYQPDAKLRGYLYTSPPSPCGENVLKVSTYYLSTRRLNRSQRETQTYMTSQLVRRSKHCPSQL